LLPGHRRLPAPDVGPRRAVLHRPSRPRPGGLRRRRGRPRPVLLPPSRGLPRAAGRGGDPRPRELPDLPGPPALRRPRGAPVTGGRRVPRSALAGPRRGSAGVPGGTPPTLG